jgi:FtsH-binding integral membrane protein
MANEFNRSSVIQGRTVADAAIDEGLRSYMLRVYNYMTTGLALTGIVAYLVSSTPALPQLFYAQNSLGQVQPTILAYVAMFSPLAFVLVLSFGIQRMRASTAQLVFWLFAGVMGLSMSHIFLTFTGAKRDLSGLGSFLMMGLVGVILASIVNMLIGSTVMQFAISVIGVLVFVGLTAYDTQKIKEMYNELDGSEVAGKKAIMGALRLYLDFINMFMLLLHLFGNRN